MSQGKPVPTIEADSLDVETAPAEGDVVGGAQPSGPRSSPHEDSVEETFAHVWEDGRELGRDDRPELTARLDSAVHRLTRPPTIYVQLQISGEPPRVYSSQALRTTAEAILLVLARLIRELDVPTRVRLTTVDPTVFRMLSSASIAPPWLRRAADELEYETNTGDVTIVVDHLEHGDDREEPYGTA